MYFCFTLPCMEQSTRNKRRDISRTHTTQLIVSTDTLSRSNSRGRLTENGRASRLYTPSRGDATLCCYYATPSSKVNYVAP